MYINNLDASNSILFVAFGAIGALFLLASFDGRSIHGLGLLSALNMKQRYTALVSGIFVALTPLTITMLYFNLGISEMWIAAGEYFISRNPFSFAIGLAAYIVYVSPLFALAAWLQIIYDKKRERKHQTA